MQNCLFVGIGGFAGAVLRYLIGLAPVRETMVFPVKTFVINILGCILIGCIAAIMAKDTNAPLSPRTVLLLKTGVCGGFTTFSTFALETADLIKDGHSGTAAVYAGLSVVIGTGAVFLTEMFMK
ncbi:MAG: fluoride efflux transporter CrcB [Dorea sp.]|nr:fluoride efflux transporter CrcB [Dorea sp.]